MFIEKRTIPLCVILQIISLCTYTSFLYRVSNISIGMLAVGNFIVYMLYCMILIKTLITSRENSNNAMTSEG